MSDLLVARTQMAVSPGFHIAFAEIGNAMPLMMVLAEWRARRTGDPGSQVGPERGSGATG
jgi:cytochrome bd ubiquinol oxidase subunit I